jgi:DUF971 family protein
MPKGAMNIRLHGDWIVSPVVRVKGGVSECELVVAAQSSVQVGTYNSLGQSVRELVNEGQDAGVYSAK